LILTNLFILHISFIDVLKGQGGSGGTVMTKMGSNDARRVVWALRSFFFVFCILFYVNLFLYMYLPTRLWGVDIGGDQPHDNP
jgi:hypothetical protein